MERLGDFLITELIDGFAQISKDGITWENITEEEYKKLKNLSEKKYEDGIYKYKENDLIKIENNKGYLFGWEVSMTITKDIRLPTLPGDSIS